MDISFDCNGDDNLPERLYYPDTSHCATGHRLLNGNQPTPNLQWRHSTGQPECGVCADQQLHFIQAALARQNNGQLIERCPQGHQVSHDSHDLRISTKRGKLDVEAVCKACGSLNKALPAASPAALTQRQRVVPQAQLKDLRVAITREGRLGLFHGNRVAGNVTVLATQRVPSRLNVNYARRSRELQRATATPPELDVGRILKNTTNGRCHHCGQPFQHGEQVSFDHYIPLRGGGWHGDDNLRLIHLEHNRARQDRMPTEAEALEHGMKKLLPIVRVLNPLNRAYKANAVPLSHDQPRTFGEVTGQRGGKWTHYQIPGFNQHAHDELQKDATGRAVGRHAAINEWLDAVLRDERGRQVSKIADWDRGDLSHQVFVRDQAGVPYLHPALKDYLLQKLPEEQRPHLRLLRGGSVWLRTTCRRA